MGDRDLHHHLAALGKAVEAGPDPIQQDGLGVGLVVDRHRHLGLEDGHQPVREHLLGDVELLGHDRLDAHGVRGADHRAFLGAEDALGRGAVEQVVEVRHRLHQLNPVLGVRQPPLVDLEERHDSLVVPQIRRGRSALDVAVHRLFEQDGREDPVTAEGG